MGAVFLGSNAPAQDTSAKDLVFITEQLPPFNFAKEGKLQGISVDLLEDILYQMGIDLNRSDIQLLSYSEGYQRALNEEGSVLFSTARLLEREKSFRWAGPIITIRDVLLAKKERAIEISDPGDLGIYDIGVLNETSPIVRLLSMGVSKDDLVVEDDAKTLVEMLENDTIDLMAYPEISALYSLEAAGLVADDYEAVYVLGEYDLYYAFNADVPESLIGAFQDVLDDTKEIGDDGTSEYQKILYRYLPVRYSQHNITEKQVLELVDRTAADLEEDAPKTLAKIYVGEHPYRDQENPDLYVFIYDTNVTLVAEAGNPELAGRNMKGKVDVSGKMFRDELVFGALEKGTGSVDYIWTSPTKPGLFYKTTYYKRVTGSDGVEYVVCAGRYKEGA